jgi:3-oxoacyl-[acyl-carrier protein] reductase
MDLALKDKIALVTGASRGIGRGIAAALGAEGCNLVVCGRNSDVLEETAEGLRKSGVDVLAVRTDITSRNESDALVAKALDKFGKIDILVNNVGGNRRKPFDQTTDEDWRDLIDLNFTAHTYLSRLVIRNMKEHNSGSIIFISSIFGREAGGPGLAIYNSTKSAMISLAKIMALELAPHGIRVNSVAPGSIRFPGGSWDKRCNENPEEMAEFIKRELPLGRFGRVDEVADVVAFLASERASLITGSCINIDGGQSRSLI